MKFPATQAVLADTLSRPARGAWVEIRLMNSSIFSTIRRAPQGARGLKSARTYRDTEIFGRAPQGARGLKFAPLRADAQHNSRRAPQGARGLKYRRQRKTHSALGRAPQGARGLK